MRGASRSKWKWLVHYSTSHLAMRFYPKSNYGIGIEKSISVEPGQKLSMRWLNFCFIFEILLANRPFA
jgi:hypothetical protein